jgi:hypothetical protein
MAALAEPAPPLPPLLANQLLIALQKPDATRVAGFRAWLRLGYAVRRGERSIKIWVPIPPSKQKLGVAGQRRGPGEPAAHVLPARPGVRPLAG